jgi:hypothetical protein
LGQEEPSDQVALLGQVVLSDLGKAMVLVTASAKVSVME